MLEDEKNVTYYSSEKIIIVLLPLELEVLISQNDLFIYFFALAFFYVCP